MGIKTTGLVLACVLVVVGCSANQANMAPAATGGSKADGIVVVTSPPINGNAMSVNWAAGESQAIQRCQRWGYAGAEVFGGATSRLIGPDPWLGWLSPIYQHERTYQCVDEISEDIHQQNLEEETRKLEEKFGVPEDKPLTEPAEPESD